MCMYMYMYIYMYIYVYIIYIYTCTYVYIHIIYCTSINLLEDGRIVETSWKNDYLLKEYIFYCNIFIIYLLY